MKTKLLKQMKTKLAICCAAATVLLQNCLGNTPGPADVAKKLSELFLSTDPTLYKPAGYSGYKAYGGGKYVHYATVSLWVNALECARKSGDTNLEERLVAKYHELASAYASRANNVLNDYRHVDLSVVGALPLEVAILTGGSDAAKIGIGYAERQWEEPSPGLDWGEKWYGAIPLEVRSDWWRKGYSPQTRLWIDDMYMITLLQTQAYRLSGDLKYVRRAAREMCMYLEKLQREDGLFNHAPGAPFAWGRGNGWMAAGMAMNLEFLPKTDPSYAPILAGYRKMMAALLRHQRASGLWGQIVDDAGSWDETSGSAMFAYALQKGLNLGLFKECNASWWSEEAIRGAVDRAYAALVAKLDSHGNLADVCAGTGWKNDRNHYLTRPRVNGDPHGQAPLLWLCGAML